MVLTSLRLPLRTGLGLAFVRAFASGMADLTFGRADATSAVILCHGLGDTGAGWEDTVRHALAPRLPNTRFVLPTAPSQPVTINGGARMPSWYDIESLSKSRALEKCAGLPASVERLRGLVADQVAKGIPENRVALVGFSQGGALSL